MFVVLGASGNTGKAVAETLLRQKKKVRVVLHDAAKEKAWGEAGADVAIADVDEGATLERAFSGAEGVYVLLPPNFSSSHVRVDNNRRTHTIAAAVEAAGVPHVVLLSSIGAQQSDGTGPVLGLRDAETVFGRAKVAATFVRAAYFMENWGGSPRYRAGRPSDIPCRGQGDSPRCDAGRRCRRCTPARRGRERQTGHRAGGPT